MNIHLAGAEVREYAEIIAYTGHKSALCSYFYMRPNAAEKVKARVIAPLNAANVEVIIDSGVFSMMFGVGKDKTYSIEELSDYADEYIETAAGYGLKRFTLVEMDVHKILGMDAVFRLREKFEKCGHSVMYVWHVEEGIEGLERLAKRYKYIAIGCPELRKVFKGKDISYKTAVWDLLGKIQQASPELPKVHLLGNTVAESMETQLAWSCDSTSWLAGTKYGNAVFFNGKKIVKAHIRSPLFQQMRDEMLKHNPAFIEWVQQFKSETTVYYYKNLYAQAMTYHLYQQFIDRRYQWCGDESKLKERL